jgi:hypothetical protein
MQIKFEEEEKGGDHMINPENDGSSSSDEDFDKLDNNSIIERIAEKGVADIAEVRL